MSFIPLLSVIGLLAARCLTKLDFLLQHFGLTGGFFTMSEITWLALASYEAFQKPLVIFVSCIKMRWLPDTHVSVYMCSSLLCLLCISLSERRFCFLIPGNQFQETFIFDFLELGVGIFYPFWVFASLWIIFCSVSFRQIVNIWFRSTLEFEETWKIWLVSILF